MERLPAAVLLSWAGLVLSCIRITQAGHFAVNLVEMKGGRHHGQLWSHEPWLTFVLGQGRASPDWRRREGSACIGVFLMPCLLIGHVYLKAFIPPCISSVFVEHTPKPVSQGLFYETTHSFSSTGKLLTITPHVRSFKLITIITPETCFAIHPFKATEI
ncbi:hypothetical protein AMECASPLE_020362 [Ameca splendens]|uniref:Uncharacterized protein n=1 Tax=Ameca splendens TaxID=208324 RepID=A0ABV0XS42_9TELE